MGENCNERRKGASRWLDEEGDEFLDKGHSESVVCQGRLPPVLLLL